MAFSAACLARLPCRPPSQTISSLLPAQSASTGTWLSNTQMHAGQVRATRHRAPDAGFAASDLAQARKWMQNFSISQVPKGKTIFSRSSGPGGQHVNKTESKATTTWSIIQLEHLCPKLMHTGLRESKFFAQRSNSMIFHAEEHRSKTANQDENPRKLYEELQKIYKASVPGGQSAEKVAKYTNLAKKASEDRMKAKRFASAKKKSRKGEFAN
ncbi:uncharacterized protein MKZ38_005075 [Zalerion maritima]|uniref:Prokaryotic-type class I peptide chain release factors domain-containing protein n=1 Tax=Zalerion maritima TaxID=339359 RepID=A0AAD5WQL8_9PEZI|nr:uncharacterized protein MKZ38_005075 [Zalerion maritima]